MNDNTNNENAVSVYGENEEHLDDFPILKAFQQYIDAEQAKARKRMTAVCICFVLVIAALIAGFVYWKMSEDVNKEKLNQRNQELNDKLLEYAMTDRNREPVENPKTDAALKALTETLTALQKQISAQDEKLEKAVAERANEGPTEAQKAMEKQIQEDTEKLRKARALLAAEKDKLAAEREKIHQQEVEMQRRRLYPEYYQQQEAAATPAEEKKPVVVKPKNNVVSSRPVKPKVGKDGSVNYFDEYDDSEDEYQEEERIKKMISALPEKKPAKSTAKKPQASKISEGMPIEDVKPVEYFKVSDGGNEDDSWVIPAE